MHHAYVPWRLVMTRPSDIERCTPLGSTPLPVQGKGVVKMCVGNYMDHNGVNHPVDLEIENVYWVPYSSMNVLATPEINTQNIFLYTGPRGNELIMPGFTNQKLGKFFGCEQEVDNVGSPVLVFNLGKGTPIMRSHPVDNGLVWAQHEANGLLERKIGQLTESTRAALLASDLPAYLWPEVYMAMCHTQNIVPSSALQRELKKKEQLKKKKEEKSAGKGDSAPGETG